jgi:opacity protein-like surface antigen
MKKLLPVLFVVFSGALYAQSGEAWFSAGGSILTNANLGSPVVNGNPSDVQLNDGFSFGFRLGINTGNHFGHEIQYEYNRTHFLDNTGDVFGTAGSYGMAIHQGGYNFLYYFTPEGSRIHPFVTGGVMFDNFVPPGSSSQSGGGSLKFGFNYGVGVKVRITHLFAVRADLREYESGKPSFGGLLVNQSGLLNQTEATAGFGLYF